MAGKGRSETRLVAMPEVLSIMQDRKKDGELGYEQTLAFEYAEKFSRIKESDAKKMKKELEELGIDGRLALKFIEILPDEPNLVKLILAMDKNRQPTSDETVSKLIEVVKSYSK
jgi:DNA-directed RNA polymerase subunit F